MQRIGTAVTRRTRMTALALATAAPVAALVWAASSGPTHTTSAPVTASALADADAVAYAGTDTRPVPGWFPPELRADLRELHGLEPEQRQEAAARIWQDALAGDYGPRVRTRAEQAQHRYQALPEALRDDLGKLRGLGGEELHDGLLKIRDKALDGGYGDQAQRWAERRSSFWQQD